MASFMRAPVVCPRKRKTRKTQQVEDEADMRYAISTKEFNAMIDEEDDEPKQKDEIDASLTGDAVKKSILPQRLKRPKLTSDDLRDPTEGLDILLKQAKRLKLTGKYVQDFGNILSTFDDWMLRLFPHASPKESVERLAKESSTRSARDIMERIRLDSSLLYVPTVVPEPSLTEKVFNSSQPEPEIPEMAELAPEKPDIIEDSDDGEWEVQLADMGRRDPQKEKAIAGPRRAAKVKAVPPPKPLSRPIETEEARNESPPPFNDASDNSSKEDTDGQTERLKALAQIRQRRQRAVVRSPSPVSDNEMLNKKAEMEDLFNAAVTTEKPKADIKNRNSFIGLSDSEDDDAEDEEKENEKNEDEDGGDKKGEVEVEKVEEKVEEEKEEVLKSPELWAVDATDDTLELQLDSNTMDYCI